MFKATQTIYFKLFDNSSPTNCIYRMSVQNAVWQYYLIYCIRILLLVLYVVVLNWYFIIDSMIDTHGLHHTAWSGKITIIRANFLLQSQCELRHKSFYDRAYKLHCGMIVMFIFANYTTSLMSCL